MLLNGSYNTNQVLSKINGINRISSTNEPYSKVKTRLLDLQILRLKKDSRKNLAYCSTGITGFEGWKTVTSNSDGMILMHYSSSCQLL